MDKQDRSRRVLALGLVLTVIGLIFSFGYARATTFDERFSAGTLAQTPDMLSPTPLTPTPKSDELFPAEQWNIKLVLLIDGRVARAIPYNEETYPTDEACKNAVIADLPLQASAQAIAVEAIKQFGPTASVGIACSMHLD